MRLLAIVALGVTVWLVAATQVPVHVRLSIASVVIGATVTQPFGCTTLELEPFDPLCPWHHIHTGIDLAAPAGTEVHSATDGVVLLGFDPAGAGNFVVVTVDAHVRVLYCHLAAFRVASGQAVTPGAGRRASWRDGPGDGAARPPPGECRRPSGRPRPISRLLTTWVGAGAYRA